MKRTFSLGNDYAERKAKETRFFRIPEQPCYPGTKEIKTPLSDVVKLWRQTGTIERIRSPKGIRHDAWELVSMLVMAATAGGILVYWVRL